MLDVTKETFPELQQKSQSMVFIHTPFCGTCQLAEKMLRTVEAVRDESLYFKLNASLFPDFMQGYQIESVPCLLMLDEGKVMKRIYAFQSVPFVLEQTNKFLAS